MAHVQIAARGSASLGDLVDAVLRSLARARRRIPHGPEAPVQAHHSYAVYSGALSVLKHKSRSHSA